MKMKETIKKHSQDCKRNLTLASSSLEISPSLSLSNNANVSLDCGWIEFEANLLMINKTAGKFDFSQIMRFLMVRPQSVSVLCCHGGDNGEMAFSCHLRSFRREKCKTCWNSWKPGIAPTCLRLLTMQSKTQQMNCLKLEVWLWAHLPRNGGGSLQICNRGPQEKLAEGRQVF